MKEPKRLLSQGATDFERQLLRAVVSERPSALLRSRMQRGLGLVGPLAWASTVKAMLGSAAGKVTAFVALGVLAAATVATVKLLPDPNVDAGEPPVAVHAAPAAASLDGETSGAAAEPVAAEPITAVPVAEAPVTTQPAAVTPPAVTPPAVTPPAVTPAAVAAASAVTPQAVAPAEAASAAPAPEEDDRQLREEIALIDGARAALERGDREAARSSLRVYRERFPAGVLAREANVLRRRAERTRARTER